MLAQIKVRSVLTYSLVFCTHITKKDKIAPTDTNIFLWKLQQRALWYGTAVGLCCVTTPFRICTPLSWSTRWDGCSSRGVGGRACRWQNSFSSVILREDFPSSAVKNFEILPKSIENQCLQSPFYDWQMPVNLIFCGTDCTYNELSTI